MLRVFDGVDSGGIKGRGINLNSPDPFLWTRCRLLTFQAMGRKGEGRAGCWIRDAGMGTASGAGMNGAGKHS